MKRLLIATDLSPRAANALQRALLLAGQTGAEVHVVHVVDVDLPTTLAEHARADAAQELRRAVDANAAAKGISVHIHVLPGHPVADVLRAADSKGVDLIMLGTHRKQPLKDVLVGGTADQIIRLAKTPVLVVRDAPARPYQRLLGSVDFSDSSRRAVEFARAQLPGVPMDLLHVYPMAYAGVANLSQDPADATRTEEQLRNLLTEEERQSLATWGAPVSIRAGAVTTVIAEEVARRGTDLLVLGSHGRGGIARALLGSVAAKLVHEPPCDVLVVRQPDRS